LPDGWSWTTIGELAEHSSGQWGEEPGASEIDVPVVRSTETRGEIADFRAAEVRSLSRQQLEKTALQDGDILVNKSSGSAHLVGRPSLIAGLQGASVGFSNFMLRLRPNEAVEPRLLFGFLASPAGRSLFLRLNRTTSGLRNLILDRYLRVPVPYPSSPSMLADVMGRVRAVDVAVMEARAVERSLKELQLATLLDAMGTPRAP
jgi:type I restriction enzyme S subunit